MILSGKFKIYEDNKDGVELNNSVTELFEEIVATMGIEQLFCQASPIEAGQTWVNTLNPSSDASLQIRYYDTADYAITAYFLNLDDAEKSALSKKSNLLPVYTSSFEVDPSKIVGYATAKYEATGEKEGHLVPITGENLVNTRKHGLKFRWEGGVLSGTYNAIAIGVNVLTEPYAGVSLQRGLDNRNVVAGDSTATGYFACPGLLNDTITITTANEILIGDGTQTDKARQVVNLLTGEVTTLESTDPRYDYPLVDPQYIQFSAGGHHVYCTGSYIYRVDLSTKTRTQIGASGNDLFVYEGYLYSRYSATVYRAYDLSAFTYDSSKNLNVSDMGFPQVFLDNMSASSYTLRVSPLGDKYLVSLRYKNGQDGTRVQRGLICTDPTDIQGSIVEILPQFTFSNGYVVNGNVLFFGGYANSLYSQKYNYYYKTASGGGSGIYKRGLKYAAKTMIGNLFSYHVFDEPQTLPANEGVNLEYFYTFEQ